ncbi:uncharacterized protein LOC132624352 [Lycium barbarum]|uniref:uncharacterized protein LOC132624352 n=1 Tax=Lycium barbarum TaxID=112863 RepID=UPI00293F0A6B|nr:uncharacterized protein LOC132624352 [Lycium barbarum]
MKRFSTNFIRINKAHRSMAVLENKEEGERQWHVVQEDVYEVVLSFLKTGKLLQAWNCTAVTLVPKVQNPTHVKDFRPIACCTTLYKVTTKFLKNRLKTVMRDLIGGSQSPFVEGRCITDSISSHMKCSRMMIDLGFPHQFVMWIMECISTVSYSLTLNRGVTKLFQGKRGVRQGDPMSPYLFMLEVEYLQKEFDQLALNRACYFHPRCKRLGIIHICFAYDLLMFCRADLNSVRLLLDTLTRFALGFGLQANAEKSSVYVAGVSNYLNMDIIQAVGFSEGLLKFGITVPQTCVFCGLTDELFELLFFTVHMSRVCGSDYWFGWDNTELWETDRLKSL